MEGGGGAGCWWCGAEAYGSRRHRDDYIFYHPPKEGGIGVNPTKRVVWEAIAVFFPSFCTEPIIYHS